MQSPPTEWTLWAAHIGAVNLLRNQGEADGDTISENIRNAVERMPFGKTLFTAGLAAAAAGFWVHIVGPLLDTRIDLSDLGDRL